MKKKGIVIFLIILAVVVIAIIVEDYISQRPGKRSASPYEYNFDEYKNVNPALIKYQETKNFIIGFETPTGIAVANEKIFVIGDQSLKIIDFSGKLLNEIQLSETPKAVEVTDEKIFIAANKKIIVLSINGKQLDEWVLNEENSYLTSISAYEGNVFVADAGLRKVYRFSENGNLLNEFEGKKSDGTSHGFIVPSAFFDLGVTQYGDLWVVNPGMHSFENYTFEGYMRSFWENTGIHIEGFSGCCNPVYFTFLADGSFVTSEKGIVRIKIYKPSGEFYGVVAPPAKFNDNGTAPAIAADNLGNIYALDFDRKILRVFEPK